MDDSICYDEKVCEVENNKMESNNSFYLLGNLYVAVLVVSFIFGYFDNI
jgi:hypothetical protein